MVRTVFFPEDGLPAVRERLQEHLPYLAELLRRKPEDIASDILGAAAPYALHDGEAPLSVSRMRKQLVKLNRETTSLLKTLDALHNQTVAALKVRIHPPQRANRFFSDLRDLLPELSSATQTLLSDLPDKAEKKEGTELWPDSLKSQLVWDCFEIFEKYRPGEASTTTGGDFRDFVSRVFEITTGKRDADLERPVKEVLREIRKGHAPTS